MTGLMYGINFMAELLGSTSFDDTKILRTPEMNIMTGFSKLSVLHDKLVN
jgi:hypothetical protein